MTSNQRALILAFALFIFSFVVYIPSIKSEFVWDDVETIERSYYYLMIKIKIYRVLSILKYECFNN